MTDKIYVWDNGGCEGREHFIASSDEADPDYAETADPGELYLLATEQRLAAEDMLKALRGARILLRSHCSKQIGRLEICTSQSS